MSYKAAFLLSWVLFGAFAAGYAVASTVGPWSPAGLPGCRVVDATPTYAAGALVALTCNTSGQLRVTTS